MIETAKLKIWILLSFYSFQMNLLVNFNSSWTTSMSQDSIIRLSLKYSLADNKSFLTQINVNKYLFRDLFYKTWWIYISSSETESSSVFKSSELRSLSLNSSSEDSAFRFSAKLTFVLFPDLSVLV